jgi:DNA-binding LacI/PurR family transcriptional regulator
MKTKSSTTPSLPQRLSLVAQTVDSLCEGIRNGHWQKELPGERELCQSLQVSRRTLRSALDEIQRQGWIEVTERQRRRIKNRRHRQPAATAPKKVVAILMPGSFLSLPSRITFVMDTLRSKLTAAGCVVQFHILPAGYTASPARALEQFVADHPATVWLVLSAQEPMQRWFAQQPLSSLILGSCAPGISLPSVDVDLHAACHHAGGLLWRKGHRQIGLVLFKGIYGGDIASEEGLREALKDMPGAHLHVLRHDNHASSLCTLLDESMRSARPPTAYLVGGSTHVLTVMMHLMRRGKRIPQDVSVISRDNDPILDATSPSVARYAIQPEQLATRIALAVRQLAETHTMPSHAIRLMPTFVPGDSA